VAGTVSMEKTNHSIGHSAASVSLLANGREECPRTWARCQAYAGCRNRQHYSSAHKGTSEHHLSWTLKRALANVLRNQCERYA